MDSKRNLNAGCRQPGPDARDQLDSPCILQDQKEHASLAESWGGAGEGGGREVVGGGGGGRKRSLSTLERGSHPEF